MTTETDNTLFPKITPNFVPFKSAEGFQHTKNILNQIRRDVIDKIRKNEGPEQNPSLCPVLFYIALPSTGFLHNLSEITYDDLLLAPVLNGIIHKLYHSLHNDDKNISTTATKEIRNKIWGDWLTFKKSLCCSSMEKAKLRYYFDDLTKDFDQIKNLNDELDRIRDLHNISHTTLELIDSAKKLIETRDERSKAYKALFEKLFEANEDILKKIENGILSHPKYSHDTSNKEKLKNWTSLMTIIKKGETPEAKKILNKIIKVFLDLPQEMNSSLGFSKLHIRAYEEFASRNDISSIALDDLVYHPVRYKPLDDPDNFPLYNILDFFEKMFYGKRQQVSAIIFMPIRPFPNSGLIMGQAITINVGPPNLKAHIDALKLYEGRISQAIKLDFYNSIINNIMSKNSDINKVISVVGNNLRKILPASAIIVVGDEIEYAASVDVRNTPNSYEFWEYDNKDETKKDADNLYKALVPLCVDAERFKENMDLIIKKNKEELDRTILTIEKLADVSIYKNMENKLSEAIVWSLFDANALKSHFKFNRADDFKQGVHAVHTDNVSKYRLSALLITIGQNSFESKIKELKSWSEDGLITFLLFFEEPVLQEQSHMKSILESAASEIVITIASSISIAAANSEQLAKAVEAKSNIKAANKIIKSMLSDANLNKLNKSLNNAIEKLKSNKDLSTIQKFLEMLKEIKSGKDSDILDNTRLPDLKEKILGIEMAKSSQTLDFLSETLPLTKLLEDLIRLNDEQ